MRLDGREWTPPTYDEPLPVAMPRWLVEAVLERAGHYCECCGHTRPGGRYSLHHRQLRSAGGGNTIDNVMVVIPTHHNVAAGSIHQEVARSIRLGHIVPAGQDPALVPVLTLDVDRW